MILYIHVWYIDQSMLNRMPLSHRQHCAPMDSVALSIIEVMTIKLFPIATLLPPVDEYSSVVKHNNIHVDVKYFVACDRAAMWRMDI